MSTIDILVADSKFRRQAKAFAKWFGKERKAVFELGKIASEWLEHYSRIRNAERLADALHQVTGLRITGRTILYYRDIYGLDRSWRSSTRKGRARVQSRNAFRIRHVGPGHLRVVAGAKLPRGRKHDVLDEVERGRLTVKQTTALVRKREIEHNRGRRTVRLRPGQPRVYHGDAIRILQRLEKGSIHHCFCDWQWQNNGVWRESEKSTPVHREEDPAGHLCRFLRSVRPYLNQNAIVWIFGKTTAFEGGMIGLPLEVQRTANRVGLRYCSEYVVPHRVAGYQSDNTFLAIKHMPIFPFVMEGFDFSPVKFAPSVSDPLTSPNHISQLRVGEERHPYQKPVELFINMIEMGTPSGLIYDGFCGSGASGVAAV